MPLAVMSFGELAQTLNIDPFMPVVTVRHVVPSQCQKSPWLAAEAAAPTAQASLALTP